MPLETSGHATRDGVAQFRPATTETLGCSRVGIEQALTDSSTQAAEGRLDADDQWPGAQPGPEVADRGPGQGAHPDRDDDHLWPPLATLGERSSISEKMVA